MDNYWVRVLIALLLGGFLLVQARSVGNWPRRQRAFQLAAAAMVAFALLNANLALGFNSETFQLVIGILGTALFIGAIASLVLSLRDGEAREQRTKIEDAAREFREQRARERNGKR